MASRNHGEGLSEAVGFLLILAILMVTLTLYLTYLVPAMGRENEISQMAGVKERFTEYKLDIDSLWTGSQCTTAYGPALSLGGGTDTGMLSFFPFLSPVKAGAVLALNQRGESITINSSSYFLSSTGGASQNGIITVTGTSVQVNTAPQHFFINITPSDIYAQHGVQINSSNWNVWVNITPNYYYYNQVGITVNATYGNITSSTYSSNSTWNSTDITVNTNINNLPVVSNLVVYKGIGTSNVYPVDLMNAVYGISTTFQSPQTIGISVNDTGITASYLLSYGYILSGINTTWPMGSIEFRSNNNYYVPQTYYYQMGGVFLEQNDGSSAEVPPSISISLANSSPVVKIGEILIQGSVTDANVSGNAPIMLTSAVTNIAPAPLLAGNNTQWVNLTIQAASANAASMWNQTFKTLAFQGGLPSASYMTGMAGNVTFLNISGGTTYGVQLSLTQVNVSADYVLEYNFGGLSRSWQSVPGTPVPTTFTG